MANTKFTYQQTTWTGTPALHALPYVQAYQSGSGLVTITYSTKYFCSDDGVITSNTGAIDSTKIVSNTIYRKVQKRTTTSAVTILDLDLGSTVYLTQNQNTVLRINRGTGVVKNRPFKIYRVHDDTENIYTLSIDQSTNGGTWIYANCALPVWTQTKKSVDVLTGHMDSMNNVITNALKTNYRLPQTTKGNGGTIRFYTPHIKKQDTASPREITVGAMVVGMADMTLAATDIYIEATMFGYNFEWTNCLSVGEEFSNLVYTSGGIADPIVIQPGSPNYIKLTHNTDVSGLQILEPATDYCTLTVIVRKKDDTADPRNIVFDPLAFDYITAPELTQTANAIDYIYILSYGGRNILNVVTNHGVDARRKNG